MKDFSSYVLYWIFFIVSIFWSWQYGKRKHQPVSVKKKILYCILITLPIIILQGFRYDVGSDYFSYVSLYRGFHEGNGTLLGWYANEPLFIILCKCIYFLTRWDYAAFFFVDAILMNVILFFAFDYYKEQVSLPLMYFLYYMFCFPYFLNVERQGLAVILIWFATKYVHEKKLIKFLCCILIATMFHNTAIVGAAFYFINFLRGKYSVYLKSAAVAVAAFSPFLFHWGLDFLSEHLSLFRKYIKFLRTDMTDTLEAVNTNFIFMGCMIAVLILMVRVLKKSGIDIFWVAFLCVAQLLTYLLNNYIDWGFRMSFYFEFGLIYAYSFAYSNLKARMNKMALICFLALSSGFYFTYKFYIQGNCEIFPYRFLWDAR